MPDHAGLRAFGAELNKRPHHARRIDRRSDRPARIDTLQLNARKFARAALEIPPGHAVLRAHHRCVLANQRLDLRRKLCEAVRLHTTNNYIERARIFETADNFRLNFKIAAGAQHAQTARLHRLQMFAPREKRDVLPRARHLSADVAPDGARARNQKPHAPASAFATAPRWILPVAVLGMVSTM